MASFDYIRDPAEIYRRSFAQVETASDLSGFPPPLVPVVTRLVHACGMPDIVSDLRYADGLAAAIGAALKAGAPIIADCEMVAHGITRRFLPAGNKIICLLNDENTPPLAAATATTRSAAAIELSAPHLGGAIVAIGNAPTALFRLLEMIGDGGPLPAAVLAFPVGFVGAAESKQALCDHHCGVPFLTLLGRRGGSALAAAAVNAMALEASA